MTQSNTPLIIRHLYFRDIKMGEMNVLELIKYVILTFFIYIMRIITIFPTEYTWRSDQKINIQFLFLNLILNCTTGNFSLQGKMFSNDCSCQSGIKEG